ncbi:unnamed protein product [Caenorhabditis auriculariae]|uniref:Uncharacterized protein n=1 Tax=Caenorhabditis auriculariae TaxID=2777116 RepID=A0A8S1HHP6_9PELO|nr:unnamed protein product [Caenorhabditis auriculariae]
MIHGVLLVSLLPVAFALPPPEGVHLKRARHLPASHEDKQLEPPPNLKIRSRMMAAMNSNRSTASPEKPERPLVFTKFRKINKGEQKPTIEVITSAPSTTVKPEKTGKDSGERVNLAVRPFLQTNFVDANGHIVHDVIAIPIRVSDGHIHAITRKPNATASSAAVEAEDKDVSVKFQPSQTAL